MYGPFNTKLAEHVLVLDLVLIKFKRKLIRGTAAASPALDQTLQVPPGHHRWDHWSSDWTHFLVL